MRRLAGTLAQIEAEHAAALRRLASIERLMRASILLAVGLPILASFFWARRFTKSQQIGNLTVTTENRR